MINLRGMKPGVRTSLIVAVVLAGAVGAYAYLGAETPEHVTVIKPSTQTIEETISSSGTMVSSRTVLVTMDPGGRVNSIHFKEQDRVRKGQLLARLDDSDLRGQLTQNRANLTLAQGNRSNADVNLSRLRRLYEKGFAARQDVESAERQVELYKTQIEDRTAAISMLEAKQVRTMIVSPINGVVTRKLAEEGGIVAERDARAPGQAGQSTAIAELAELGSLEFQADVDQADIAKIRVGQTATVEIDAFPGRTFVATPREVAAASTPDVANRVRYAVKLAMRSGKEVLQIGMTGSARFVIAKKAQTLTVPVSVTLQQGNDESVFVVENGKASLRKIKTGLRSEDAVEVVSGVVPGDLVIDQGRAKLKNGRHVEVVDAKR